MGQAYDMKWLNAHSVCFVVGLGLTIIGVSAIYRPAAAITAGVILMVVSTLGDHKGTEP